MKNNKNNNTVGSLLFIGFMFTGGGLGEFFNAPAAGGAIGMGLGFIAMAIVIAKGKGEEEDR